MNKALRTSFLTLLCAFITSCGGSNPPSPNPPSPPPTNALNVVDFLAQAANSNGTGGPVQTDTPWAYRRFDFAPNDPNRQPWPFAYQMSQTFQRDVATFQTIWAYGEGPANTTTRGDGGEVYQTVQNTDGTTDVFITETQDSNQPITTFGKNWWLFSSDIPDCSTGWKNGPDGRGRACYTNITFSATGVPGNSLTLKSVVSEHYAVPYLMIGPMERIILGQGYGRLVWQAFNQPNCTQVDPARTPPISQFDTGPGPAKCDERLTTQFVPFNGSMSGQTFGWLPPPVQ